MKLTLPPIHYLVKRDRSREPVDSVRGMRFTPDRSLARALEVSSNFLKAGSGHNPEPMRRRYALEYLIVRLDLQNFPQRPFCYRTPR
jgi:hypothetical protein